LLCLEYASMPGECLPVRPPRPTPLPHPIDDEDWQTDLSGPADAIKSAG